MKILNIYKTYYPDSLGGVEQGIFGLAKGLNKRGVETAVLTTTPKPTFSEGTIDKTQVYYFPQNINISSCPMSWEMALQFQKIIEPYDLLHFHFPWPFADLLSLIPNNKPYIVTYHSDIVKQSVLKWVYWPLMHVFLKRAAYITTTSPNMVQHSSVLKCYRDKTVVIPVGFDPSMYPNPSIDLLDSWQKKVGKDFIFFIGVLRYYKGLQYLLRAAEGTDLPIVIAGSGPEEYALKKEAEARKLKNVIFLGRITEEDKAALLSLCRAVIAPAHLPSEAFCISLLEGLIFSKPLISTELGTGTSYVNQHNVSGLVVPPANPPALRAAMLALYENIPLYESLTKGAIQHYKDHFTADTVVDKHMALYQKILGEK